MTMFKGVELEILREERGLTKIALAKRAGLSRSTLSRLESGLHVPSIETLVRLANSLELPLPKLLSKVGILKKKDMF